MPRARDPFWEYVTEEGGTKIRCNFCQEVFVGHGITRMKYHFAKLVQRDVRPCSSVPDFVNEMALEVVQQLDSHKKTKMSDLCRSFQSGGGSSMGLTASTASSSLGRGLGLGGHVEGSGAQPKMHHLTKKTEKELADYLLVKALVANNLPFHLLWSQEFKDAIIAISNYGPGYLPPSSETDKVKIFTSLKDEVKEYIKTIKESWAVSGCTIMSNSWTDAKKRPHVNLLVVCSKGTIFLKSECIVGKKKDAEYIANFIASGIEDIGSENIVQFISDNTFNYSAAEIIIEGRYPNIYKTSCATHCLDLILEDIDKLSHVKPILENTRLVVKFLYKFQHVLDLMRSYTKKRKLKRPSRTGFASQFIFLQSIIKEEQALRFMIASAEWRALPQSKTKEGIQVANIIQENINWEMGREIIQTIEPLVRVLRMVNGDGSTMGYIYISMDKAKEEIKEVYKGNVEKYMPFWKIIDDRWNKTLHSPLHAVAAYFNPQLFYNNLVRMDKEVRMCIENVVDKLIPSLEEGKKFSRELTLYHMQAKSIFSKLAIESLSKTHPRIWWDMWGSGVPVIQKLAIKLHSQPCSVSTCERNLSTFEVEHTKKRNRLEPDILHDMVFIRMNLHLMKTSASKEKKNSEPIKILAFPDVPEGYHDLEDGTSSSESLEDEDDADIDDHDAIL